MSVVESPSRTAPAPASDDAPRPPGMLARIGWNSLGSLVALVAQLLLTPFLLGQLGVDRYGLWALIVVIITSISVIDGGVGASLAFFFSKHRGTGDAGATARLATTSLLLFAAFGALVTLAFGAAMPVVLAAADVSDSLRREALSLRLLVGPLLGVGLLTSVFTALLAAHHRYRAIGLIATARATALVGGSIALLGGGGLRTVALVSLGAAGVAFVLSVVAGGRLLDPGRAGLLRPEERRSLWAYASRMQLSGLTSLVSVQLDALLIGLLLPVRYVGIYTIGANVALALRAIPMFALGPVFTHLAQRFAVGGLDAAAGEYRRANHAWCGAVAGYAATVTAAVGFAVHAWLGPSHAQSAAVAVVVFAGYGVNLLTGAGTSFVRAIGRPGLETRYALWSSAVNVVLTVPCGLLFGLYGIIGATAAGTAFASLYFFRLLRERVPENLGSPWPAFRPAGVLAAVAVTLLGEIILWRHAPAGPGVFAAVLTGLPAAVGLAVVAFGARRTLVGGGSIRGVVWPMTVP